MFTVLSLIKSDQLYYFRSVSFESSIFDHHVYFERIFFLHMGTYGTIRYGTYKFLLFPWTSVLFVALSVWYHKYRVPCNPCHGYLSIIVPDRDILLRIRIPGGPKTYRSHGSKSFSFYGTVLEHHLPQILFVIFVTMFKKCWKYSQLFHHRFLACNSVQFEDMYRKYLKVDKFVVIYILVGYKN